MVRTRRAGREGQVHGGLEGQDQEMNLDDGGQEVQDQGQDQGMNLDKDANSVVLRKALVPYDIPSYSSSEDGSNFEMDTDTEGPLVPYDIPSSPSSEDGSNLEMDTDTEGSSVPYDIPSPSSSEDGSNFEVDTDTEGPSVSHEIETNLDPTMEMEVKQEQIQVVKEEEVKKETVTTQPKRNPVRKARGKKMPFTPTLPPSRPKRKVEAKPDKPKRQKVQQQQKKRKPAEPQQPGPSRATANRNRIPQRRSETTGNRKRSMKGGDQSDPISDILGGHDVYYGKSLPPNLDLEDYDTQIKLRVRFYHQLHKLVTGPNMEMRVEAKPCVKNDIKIVKFILALREWEEIQEEENNEFLDRSFGTIIKVIGGPEADCSTVSFQITDEALAQELGCTVARMVVATEEVFGIALGDEKAFGWS